MSTIFLRYKIMTYGIPIINKRISVTPISLVGSNIGVDGYVRLAQVLERAANDVGVNSRAL